MEAERYELALMRERAAEAATRRLHDPIIIIDDEPHKVTPPRMSRTQRRRARRYNPNRHPTVLRIMSRAAPPRQWKSTLTQRVTLGHLCATLVAVQERGRPSADVRGACRSTERRDVWWVEVHPHRPRSGPASLPLLQLLAARPGHDAMPPPESSGIL